MEVVRETMTVEAAHRLLVVAILAQAVVDIVAGRESVAWLDGAACRHWCEWVDLEPSAVRREVTARVGAEGAGRVKKRLRLEQLAWALERHYEGASWAEVATALGVSHTTLRYALKRTGFETGYRTDRADGRRPAVLEV